MTIYAQLSALSDPTRTRLMALLVDEELAVGELTRIVQMPQSTISRHLKVLLAAGWLSRRSEGTASYFWADPNGYSTTRYQLWDLTRSALLDDPQLEEDRNRMVGVIAQRSVDTEAFFGRVAGEWDSMRRDLFGDDFPTQCLASLLPREWVVADLGCGTGDLVAQMAGSVSKVIGIDREEAMLAVAEQRLKGAKNVALYRGSLSDLPLENSTLDVALCMLVLHHVAELAPVLSEVSRVLKPSGLFLVVDMRKHSREAYRKTMGHQHLGFDRDELSLAARKHQLTEIDYQELEQPNAALGPGLFLAKFQRNQ